MLTHVVARTAVHFQGVSEGFQPYETLLEITSAEELNDTSLASSFPLHTASPSTSSNRLHEISEDGEDGGAALRRPPPTNATSAGPMFGTQRYKTERRVDQIMRSERPTPSIQVTQQDGLTSPITSPLASPQKTHMSHFLVREDSGQRSVTSLGSPTSVASMADYAGSDVSGRSVGSDQSASELPRTQSQSTYAPQTERSSQTSQPSFSDRTSIAASRPAERAADTIQEERSVEHASIAERPSISERPKYEHDEPYDFSKFDHLFKPKVKLGPRPVVAGERTKRPTVASIAGVPATYRPTQKKQEPAAASRPKSHGPVNAPATPLWSLPAPPPIPDIPEYNPRPLSRGSVKSLPSHKSTAMTPDKLRLMKAVELRKKQLRKSLGADKTFMAPKDEEVPAVPKMPEIAKQEPVRPLQPEAEPKSSIDEDQAPSKKADSGIEMNYDRQERREDEKRAEPMQVEAGIEQRPEPREEPRPDTSEGQHTEHHEEQHEEVSHLPASTRSPSLAPVWVETPKRQLNTEPTVSIDMLEDAQPSKPSMIEAIFADGPSTQRFYGAQGLGLSTPVQQSSSIVPSIAMIEASRPASSVGNAVEHEQQNEEALDELEGGGEDAVTKDAVEAPMHRQGRPQNSDLAKRRRGIVEPLHIESHSEGDLASDDDLLEELHSATLQEAKPITMARSPMTTAFARRPSAQSLLSDISLASVRSVNVQRQSSNPLQMHNDEQVRPSPDSTDSRQGRSYSAVTPPFENSDPMTGLKRNVSHGIQRRIQTLAEVSSREVSPSRHSAEPPSLSPETSPTFLQSERVAPVRSAPPRSRTSSYRAARQSARINGNPANDAKVVQQAESQPAWNVQHDAPSTGNSVSVTARIIRPAASAEADSAEQPEAPFQQSQLVINHKRASQQGNLDKALPPLNTSSQHLMQKPEPTASVGSSPAMSPITTRASTEFRSLHSAANRKSFGRHRQPQPNSPSVDDFPPPPTTFTSTSLVSNDENAAPKESSRTSRFFKRMSNLGGNKRRQSGAQQSVGADRVSNADAASLSTRNASFVNQDRSDMPPAAMIGDLNVQFPDSLVRPQFPSRFDH